MRIIIENRRVNKLTITTKYPESVIIYTTSHALLPYRKLSPFYPHQNIPIPFSPGHFAASVEGIWQGLKVFTECGTDESKFLVVSMKGIKRNSKAFGRIKGHLKGVRSHEVLDYITAKREIYLPSYLWVIEQFLQKEMAELNDIASKSVLVLLDYNTSLNPLDAVKPISHAALCKAYLEGTWPHPDAQK